MTTTSYTGRARPYQQVASDWLEAHPHSILADDTGLGKTRTAIMTLARHLPALVVVPTYLQHQWYDTLCGTLPHASISLPEGAYGRKVDELKVYADVRVVSIPTLRTHAMPEVETVVIDEAHHLRNPKSTQSEKGRGLLWRTNRVHLLTGTPYYKADQDIWHLLHCLDPNTFSSYWNFIREWFAVNWSAPYAPKIYGVSNKKREAFNVMLENYMLLRTYRDVGRELPPLIEETITFELPKLLRTEYTKLKRDWQLVGEPIESVGTVYYLLRQLTMCAQKLDAIKGIVDANLQDNILIYTWYKESAHTVAAKLKRGYKEEIAVLLLTGDTPPHVRESALADQKRRGYPRVIVATIEALQEGVNLEHIRHVVYAEETYVRGKHAQTLARARRDRGDAAQGTVQPPVTCYYIRARKTIDERIPAIRNSRGGAGDRILVTELRRDGTVTQL